MSEFVFLFSKILVHWGFIVRQVGASAAQTAYIMPPPTTIIGAFANPLARILDMPDAVDSKRKIPVSNKVMECAIKSSLAASAGLLPGQENTGIVVFEEPSRIMGTPYKGGGSYERAVKQPIYQSVQELLPVQAVGLASAPMLGMGIVWLFDKEVLESCLDHSLSSTDLLWVASNIYRIGSREGLVNLTDLPRIYSGEDIITEELGTFQSFLYQRADCATPKYVTDTVEALLLDSSYLEARYYIPVAPGSGSSLILPPPEPVLFLLKSKCRIAYPSENESLAVAFQG